MKQELTVAAEEIQRMNWREILELAPNEIQAICEYELNYINDHLDFKMNGIPVEQFTWECKPRLFKIGKGYCRITLHQLYKAMNDIKYKRDLEKRMKFGKLQI